MAILESLTTAQSVSERGIMKKKELPLANACECGGNCNCIVEVESQPNYYEVDRFVDLYTLGLREYLDSSLIRDREHHIEDLIAMSTMYHEAALAFISAFVREQK